MILIVDDEKGIRDVFLEFLNLFGYHADAAGTGEEALNLFDEKKYQMVITDNQMPGMSGVELIRSIKRKCPFFPVIALTGGPTEGLIEAGATLCFTKPFDLDEMREAIRYLLNSRSINNAPRNSPRESFDDRRPCPLVGYPGRRSPPLGHHRQPGGYPGLWPGKRC